MSYKGRREHGVDGDRNMLCPQGSEESCISCNKVPQFIRSRLDEEVRDNVGLLSTIG